MAQNAAPPAAKEVAMVPNIPFATDRVFIAGEWHVGTGGTTLALENPSDGSRLADIARCAATTASGAA